MSAQGVCMTGLDMTQYNIDDNVVPVSSFDNIFTESNYLGLIEDNYFKVYWQQFDGVNFVK